MGSRNLESVRVLGERMIYAVLAGSSFHHDTDQYEASYEQYTHRGPKNY